MYKLPVAETAYPVTPAGSTFGVAMITSVEAVPVAVVVTTVAHAPEPIALVPIADVPLAIVTGRVEEAGTVVPLTLVVLDRAAGRSAAAIAALDNSALVPVTVVFRNCPVVGIAVGTCSDHAVGAVGGPTIHTFAVPVIVGSVDPPVKPMLPAVPATGVVVTVAATTFPLLSMVAAAVPVIEVAPLNPAR